MTIAYLHIEAVDMRLSGATLETNSFEEQLEIFSEQRVEQWVEKGGAVAHNNED